MLRTKKHMLISMLLPLLTAACATSVPVAATCPPPKPVPHVLTEPRSTGPSLTEQWNTLMQEVRELLKKATVTD